MNAYQSILSGLPDRIRAEIPFAADVSLTRGPEMPSLRSARDVAARAVILGAVTRVAWGSDRDEARFWLSAESLWDDVSPREQDFLSAAAPDGQTLRRFRWFQECLVVLLWALDRVGDLGAPVACCEIDHHEFLPSPGQDTSDFLISAKLRDPEEILAWSEVIDQIRWKVTNHEMQTYGKKTPVPWIIRIEVPDGETVDSPGGVDRDVALEWHRALNWITGGEDWDEVTTDT